MDPKTLLISRRNVLLGSAAATVLGPRVAHATSVPSNGPTNLIVCIAKGGWDTSFTFDPKVNSEYVEGPEVDQTGHPDDIDELMEWGVRPDGSPGSIYVNNHKRRSVTEFFQNPLWKDKVALVNGMWTGSIVHQPCRIRLLTGTTSSLNPDFATIFGAEMGEAEPIGSIDFSGLGYSGQLAATTGTVGARSQLRALLDPNASFRAPTWASYQLPRFTLNESEQDAIRHVIEQRADALRAMRGDGANNDLRLDDLEASLYRRDRLRAQGLDIVENLPLGDEPSFKLQSTLAVDLIEKGLCRAVTLQHFFSWDTHKANVLQHERYDSFFGTINEMLTELHARNLLDNTLVCIISEMARTPKLNLGLGKDHWAHTSQIMVGGGVQGPVIYGGTDDLVESMRIDMATGQVVGGAMDSTGELLKYDNFCAGVLAHMGVDPGPWYPSITPFTAATLG